MVYYFSLDKSPDDIYAYWCDSAHYTIIFEFDTYVFLPLEIFSASRHYTPPLASHCTYSLNIRRW